MRANFLDMSFFAKDILEILGSQIETKWVFSLVRVLTTLKHCHLEVKNIWSNYHCDEKLVLWIVLQLQAKVKLEAKLKSKKMFDKKNYNSIEEHNYGKFLLNNHNWKFDNISFVHIYCVLKIEIQTIQTWQKGIIKNMNVQLGSAVNQFKK
jgi:hypothetical protein